ncbi:MAG: hypothetical protein ABSB76_02325, partial [Streptosporangiaceae bacterium]
MRQPASGQAPATGEVAARRSAFRLASPAGAVLLGGLVLALTVAAIPLGIFARQNVGSGGATFVLGPVFAVLGFVVAWRRPRNPLGWLMLGAVAFLVLSGDAGSYVVADYRLRHGGLPLGWVGVLLQPSWAPAIALFGLTVLLFPDGRLPSPRWRWVLWAYLAVAAAWIAGTVIISAGAIIGHNVHVDSGGNLQILNHPTGSAVWWGAVQRVFFPALLVFWLASFVGQALSYRRSSGERRLQLKWLVGGSAVALVGGGLGVPLSGNPSGVLHLVGSLGTVAVLALPVSMGVAILKYRLYDIDRLISRTLAYAVVTGLLVGLYAGLVLLATQVLSISSPVAVAASTLAAAALFSPLRRRVQRAVDRRFNRARYDADAAVAAFAARLSGAVALDDVRADLLASVLAALEP